MKKYNLLFAFIFLFSICAFAQNNQPGSTPAKKEHLKLLNPNNEDALWCEKALTKVSLDSLRFLNERRIIPIQNTSMSIELFSAQELKDNFGKPISILTNLHSSTARKVKFKLGTNGLLEVVQ